MPIVCMRVWCSASFEKVVLPGKDAVIAFLKQQLHHKYTDLGYFRRPKSQSGLTYSVRLKIIEECVYALDEVFSSLFPRLSPNSVGTRMPHTILTQKYGCVFEDFRS